MSTAAAAQTRPASRPDKLHAQVPQLRVVEGYRPTRVLIVSAVMTIVVVLTAIVASMMLHTRMAESAFTIRERQLELNALDATAWSMQAQLEQAASPSSLEQAARAQGMVPAGKTGFITLKNGTVEGGTPAR